MQKLLSSSLLLLGLALCVKFTACTRPHQLDDTILRVALKDDIKSLDPANSYDGLSVYVLPSIEETLLQYQYLNDELVLEPLLAESMPEYSKDGLTVTVKIKKGIFFQDDDAFKENGGRGRELKADDFIYEFKRLAIPAIQSQGPWIFENKVVGFLEFEKKLQAAKLEDFKKIFDEPIAGFVALDDHTLQFKLIEPYPILNYILAMSFTVPVAHETAEAYADNYGNLRDHPVGTGPFMLKSWETSQRIILSRNPNYKGTYPSQAPEKFKNAGFLEDAGKALPFLDGIVFEIIKEDQPRLLRFERGELDDFELTKDTFRAAMVDGTHLWDDLAQKHVQVSSEDALDEFYVAFNLKDKILSNKYLRQAISSAIDREKWMDTFEKYSSAKQTQLCPFGLKDRLPDAKLKYDFDLARAKSLLAKAGYPNGEGLPVLNFDFRGADTRSRQMGEMFVQMLGAIGIKINPILNTFPAYLEKAKQRNLQISYGGWNFDYPDIENGYQLFYGPNVPPGPNDPYLQDPKYDALYKKIASLPAMNQSRVQFVKQAEDYIQEEVPVAYGYYQRKFHLTSPRVKNFRISGGVHNRYKYIRVH